MGTVKDSERTRAKIIDAAGPLFAESGYKGVTVRDIAAAAGTQPGALNYHFRSKEALYREVLHEACQRSSISADEQAQLEALDASEALAIVVRETLSHRDVEPAERWHEALLTRECSQPSEAFDGLVESHFRPQAAFMTQLIARATGQDADSPALRFAELSLLSLLSTFGHYTRYVNAVAPELSGPACRGEWLVGRIVDTVLASAHPGKEEAC